MFKELLPLLEGRTMILTAAKIGDALTVTIYPKRNGEKDENPVGNTPLCVTGTAEELDHELPGLIAGYVEELGKFHSNLGQIKQQLADAATAAAEAAKVKTGRKPATAPAKPASKSAEPAEPPVARPDLFTASMPPAAASSETQPAQANAADGTAAAGSRPAAGPERRSRTAQKACDADPRQSR
jgi:PRTRC genetic system protein E